jgi:uncharacterized protein (DUF1501 family)
MLRRDFIKFCAAAPWLLHGAASQAALTAASAPPRYLLIVEFNGGNDGLNTVIPYADPSYHNLRPSIAVARDQVLQLDEHVGLHPALAPLLPLWQSKQLAVVQAVGYPEPNRSHFRSIQIWDTGSDADEYLDSGWLARALPHSAVTAGYTADAVVIGRNPEPVTGDGMRTLMIDDVESFARKGERMRDVETTTRSPALAHVLDVQREIHAAANSLLVEAERAPAPQADFPPTPFGRSLQQAARLILMRHATPVIKVALGSFDTHAQQRGQQDRLLAEFANGIAAFRTAMQQAGTWDQVLLFTYSEFGRRVAENASRGTDHGTAAPVFVAGGAVKGGLIGTPPSLTDLDQGDLRMQHDFRSIYNSVLGRWWSMPQTPFDRKRYPALGLV